MKLYLASLGINGKRLLRDRAFWAVAVLAWILLAVCGVLLGNRVSVAMVRAGVIYTPGDEVAAAVYESLPEHDRIRFEAFPPEERETVERLVQTGELECAYVLEAPFGQVLQQKGLNGAVEQIVSPGTVGDVILEELLFAAVLRAYGPTMTAGVILEGFPGSDPAWVQAYVDQRLAWYQTEGADQFLQQQAEMVGAAGVAVGRPGATGTRQLHGVLAVFLLALVLFALPRLIGEKTPGLWGRLRGGGLLQYYAGVATALWVWCMAAGAPAVLLLKMVYPAGVGALGAEAVLLAAYAAALGMIGVCLLLLLRSADILYAASVFVLLGAVLFGGVLLDWNEISSSVGSAVRWIPTERYLAGVVLGEPGAAGWLLGMAAGAGVLSLLRLGLYTRRGKV